MSIVAVVRSDNIIEGVVWSSQYTRRCRDFEGRIPKLGSASSEVEIVSAQELWLRWNLEEGRHVVEISPYYLKLSMEFKMGRDSSCDLLV